MRFEKLLTMRMTPLIIGGKRRTSQLCRGRWGFIYVEALLSMVILATAMAAGLSLFSVYAKGHTSGSETATANELAAQLMAEILARAFEDPENSAGSFGVEGGESSRADYDDVDDYHDWTATPPQDVNGTAMSEYAGYTQTVVVMNVDDDTLYGTRSNGSTESKWILVVITRNGKAPAILNGYKIKQNGYD